MSIPAVLLRMLRTRAPWAVALCYALLLQAALSPVVRAAHDPDLAGSIATVLCLTDQNGDGHTPGTGDQHDMSCCLVTGRADLAGPVLVPGTPVTLPSAPVVMAGVLRPAPPARAPPSVDLPTRSARAPPALLV